jgi:hypothetical protein
MPNVFFYKDSSSILIDSYDFVLQKPFKTDTLEKLFLELQIKYMTKRFYITNTKPLKGLPI